MPTGMTLRAGAAPTDAVFGHGFGGRLPLDLHRVVASGSYRPLASSANNCIAPEVLGRYRPVESAIVRRIARSATRRRTGRDARAGGDSVGDYGPGRAPSPFGVSSAVHFRYNSK
jgi:hypothetical protein